MAEQLDDKRLLLLHLMEVDRKSRINNIWKMYSEDGPLRRELYPKHMEFFEAGKQYRERCAMCANRIGKTLGMGGYETTLHLTGLYPTWWTGRRFDKRVRVCCAGKTNVTTRDIIQRKLFGNVDHIGQRRVFDETGLIPSGLVDMARLRWKSGVQDALDTARIKHVSGQWSEVSMKSYEQGRGAFEGFEAEVVWLDEECDEHIYGECLIRTMTTGGIVMLTFTPLEGMSTVAMSFLPGGMMKQLKDEAEEKETRV